MKMLHAVAVAAALFLATGTLAQSATKRLDRQANLITCNDYSCTDFPEDYAFQQVNFWRDDITLNQFDTGGHPIAGFCACAESEIGAYPIYDAGINKLWVITLQRPFSGAATYCGLQTSSEYPPVFGSEYTKVAVRRYNMDGTTDTTWGDGFSAFTACPPLTECEPAPVSPYGTHLLPDAGQGMVDAVPDGTGSIYIVTQTNTSLVMKKYTPGVGTGLDSDNIDTLTAAATITINQSSLTPTLHGYPSGFDFLHFGGQHQIFHTRTGKWMVAGPILTADTTTANQTGIWVARFTSTGALDTTFAGTGVAQYTWSALQGNNAWQPEYRGAQESQNLLVCDMLTQQNLECSQLIDHDNNTTTALRQVTFAVIADSASCASSSACLISSFGTAGSKLYAAPTGWTSGVDANSSVVGIDADGYALLSQGSPSATADQFFVQRYNPKTGALITTFNATGYVKVASISAGTAVVPDLTPRVHGPRNFDNGMGPLNLGGMTMSIGGIAADRANGNGVYVSGELGDNNRSLTGGSYYEDFGRTADTVTSADEGFVMHITGTGVLDAAFGTGGVELHHTAGQIAKLPTAITIPSVTAPADVPVGRPTTNFDKVSVFVLETPSPITNVITGPTPLTPYVAPGAVNHLCDLVE